MNTQEHENHIKLKYIILAVLLVVPMLCVPVCASSHSVATTCSSCDGSGVVFLGYETCPSCGGNGFTYEDAACSMCGGFGYTEYEIACSNCGGVGSFMEMCSDCSGMGTITIYDTDGEGNPVEYTETCSSCGGIGFFYYTCDTCLGSGALTEYTMCGDCGTSGIVSQTVDCTTCDGSGNIKAYGTCANCDGTGVVYTLVDYFTYVNMKLMEDSSWLTVLTDPSYMFAYILYCLPACIAVLVSALGIRKAIAFIRDTMNSA
ncbi:MAG: hypothetical protein LIO86_09700 [Lachnospiraceae bacterium]|nr:hypothetical protein [Lachnospiraceae bacterium]